MRAAQILLPVAIVVFGAVIMWEALTTMEYFNERRGAPGPGFMPFWLSLAAVVLGLALLARALLARTVLAAAGAAGAADDWPDRAGWSRILLVMAAFAGALLVLRPLGFILTTTLYVGIVGWGLGMRRPLVLLPTAIAAGIGLHVLFAVWLRVALPRGVFSF